MGPLASALGGLPRPPSAPGAGLLQRAGAPFLEGGPPARPGPLTDLCWASSLPVGAGMVSEKQKAACAFWMEYLWPSGMYARSWRKDAQVLLTA